MPTKIKLRFFGREDSLLTPAPKKRLRKDGWTDEQLQYLRDHWQTTMSHDLAQQMGRSLASVVSMGSDLGLVRTPLALKKMRLMHWKKRTDAWTEAERQFLRDNWQQMTTREIAEQLGRTLGGVKTMGQRVMGLRRTPEAVAAFYKRNINSGQFQKGQSPPNTVYGDEQVIRIRHNHKRNIDTKYIRIGFRQWKEYQHYIWEQAHGTVPKGMMLTFINGDQMDCRLDNLRLITMKENAIRNSASLKLTDGYVANTLAWRDKALQQELLQHPELIDLKRTQLQLNRSINHEQQQPPGDQTGGSPPVNDRP